MIKGKVSVITKLKEIFEQYEKTDTFTDFGNLFFPIEEHIQDMEPMYSSNYGTSWWDFEINEISDTAINITGDSAWGPPLQLMKMIATHYDVEVEHSFDEPGMDFAGIYEWCGDELIKEENMSSAAYGYMTEGAVYIVENCIHYLDDNEEYESFEDYIGRFSFDINPDDLKYLREEYYTQITEIMDKKKVLEELKEVETHLKNLSMESLAAKVSKIYCSLEVEWKEELETDEKEDSISEA